MCNVYIYIYIYISLYSQKCTSKGIGRQGTVLERRIPLQKEPNYALSSYALTCVALILSPGWPKPPTLAVAG